MQYINVKQRIRLRRQYTMSGLETKSVKTNKTTLSPLATGQNLVHKAQDKASTFANTMKNQFSNNETFDANTEEKANIVIERYNYIVPQTS